MNVSGGAESQPCCKEVLELFMMLMPAPHDLITGEPNESTIATLNIEK